MSTSRRKPDSGDLNSERVQIGRILGAHGIKGALRVYPLTDYPARFFEMDTLYVERTGKPPLKLAVQKVASNESRKQLLVTVAGIEDRDGAEALAGAFITVSREERVTLGEGEYWIDSLLGMDVFDVDGDRHLGKVEDVMPTGGNDVYRIRTPDGDLKMIPAVASVVRDIDVNAGVMKISLLEGLWD